jgi:hypothetical protein
MTTLPFSFGSRVMIQRGGAVVAIKRVQLVDLARAAHLEQRFQRRQVGLAELGDVAGFEGVRPSRRSSGDCDRRWRQLGRLGVACRAAG